VTKFSAKHSKEGIRANLYMIEEIRERARIRGEAMKRRMEMRQKSKVVLDNSEFLIWCPGKTNPTK